MLEKTLRKPQEILEKEKTFNLGGQSPQLTVYIILIFSNQVLDINTLTLSALDFFTRTASWHDEYFLFCSPKTNRLFLVLGLSLIQQVPGVRNTNFLEE